MLFWALMASGQITMRRVGGWQTLDQAPVADTVRIWLRSKPKLRGLPSALSIIEALAERFPCK